MSSGVLRCPVVSCGDKSDPSIFDNYTEETFFLRRSCISWLLTYLLVLVLNE